MKKIQILCFQISLIFIFVFFSSNSKHINHKGYNKNCNSSNLSVNWDDSDNTGTNIRSSPGGSIIYKITSENFPEGCCFVITESSNGWFKISSPIEGPDYNINLPNNGGWIHKSVISVGTRNYGNQPIKLYNIPNGNNVVSIIRSSDYKLRINDICGSWVQVIFNGKLGWVQEEWLCGNPWTTCN
jgi:hypothetical protein